jgi:uncharacterized protein YndB with AHSA1/START domain
MSRIVRIPDQINAAMTAEEHLLMPTITSSVVVQRPAQSVFDFMVDPRNQVEWSPNFLSLDTPPDGPLGIGTRFRGTVKNFGAMELEYSTFEPPRRFAMATDHKLGHLTHSFAFVPMGADTRVEQTVGFQPRGLARLIAPLMVPMLRRMVRNLDRQIAQTVNRDVPAAAV